MTVFFFSLLLGRFLGRVLFFFFSCFLTFLFPFKSSHPWISSLQFHINIKDACLAIIIYVTNKINLLIGFLPGPFSAKLCFKHTHYDGQSTFMLLSNLTRLCARVLKVCLWDYLKWKYTPLSSWYCEISFTCCKHWP